MITIPIEKLYPHPNNPRVDVGDTSELAESIRAKGVLQNLTVVPKGDDAFTVIIGHRRMAAAMEAGLDKLPCNVVDMTPAEQMETMLMENMQRSDLTPYEEAQGFQMMMNLGTSKTKIAEKTGFSQTTINHRLKLLDLDQDILQSTQVSMNDLIALEKIDDADVKNELLEQHGGDSDFAEIVDEKYKEIHEEQIKDLLISEVELLGIKLTSGYPLGCSYIGEIKYSNYKKLSDVLEELGFTEYEEIVCSESYFSIDIYRKREEDSSPKAEETADEKAKRKAMEEQWAMCENAEIKIKELEEEAYDNRIKFMTELFTSGAELNYDSIAECVVANITGYHLMANDESVGAWLIDGFDGYQDDYEEDPEEFENEHNGMNFIEFCRKRIREADPLKVLFATCVTRSEHQSLTTYARDAHGCAIAGYSSCIYEENTVLTAVYLMLDDHGYKPDDWEEALIYGEHVAYVKPEYLIGDSDD